MNKLRAVAPLALVVVGGLTYATVSTSPQMAQAQQSEPEEDLKAKVERLEKQVASLQKQVEQLKRQPVVIRAIPAVPQRGAIPRGEVPRDWKQFDFNGQSYYTVPIEKAQQTVKQPVTVIPAK